MPVKSLQTAGFGGGCHWCTEAVFQSLRGVRAVRQGFIRSDAPNDSWSEAVEVDFEPAQISFGDLLVVHLATHASASEHKMRGKYRSAVYVLDDGGEARQHLAAMVSETGVHFVTAILPHRGFKASDARFHDYYATNPARPFCQTYIDPKLAKLRARFSNLLRVEPETDCELSSR